MGDEMSCALCRRPVEARQNVLFQADGGVVHVACVVSTWTKPTRAVPEPTPDPICPICTKAIRPTQSKVKDGASLLHVDCFLRRRRPIAGGMAVRWTLVGDEQIGRYLGTTRAGCQTLMAACADTVLVSKHLVARARGVVATLRAARRSSAA
jgi:hypothetical protein